MTLSSLKDLYLDELGNLYDAEAQTILMLPRLADAARAPELKETLVRHCEESRLHLERLELIFTHWGERVRPHHCHGLAGIALEADDRLTEPTTDDTRDAAIIGVAQRIEHYEIAGYGCARTYARRLNRPDEARLLQETLKEEGRADHRLTEIAEAHVNDDARTEADLHAQRPRRLRYLDPRHIDTRGPIAVHNDDGETLGVFEGLIVDASSNAPRYLVVDAGGFIVGGRYLLPLQHVRFDEAAHVLRVDLAKDVADRYPAFDRAEFEAMGESALRRYEGRLLEFFPRDRSVRPPPVSSGELPAWLVVDAPATPDNGGAPSSGNGS